VSARLAGWRADPRDPRKQEIATDLLRDGIADGSLRLPHQAIIEFVAAVNRPSPTARPC